MKEPLRADIDGAASVTQRAAEWYLRLFCGPEVTHHEKLVFLLWLKRSPEHVAELIKIHRLHGTLRAMAKAAGGPVAGRTVRDWSSYVSPEVTVAAGILSTGAGLFGLTWHLIINALGAPPAAVFPTSSILQVVYAAIVSVAAVYIGSVVGFRAVQSKVA